MNYDEGSAHQSSLNQLSLTLESKKHIDHPANEKGKASISNRSSLVRNGSRGLAPMNLNENSRDDMLNKAEDVLIKVPFKSRHRMTSNDNSIDYMKSKGSQEKSSAMCQTSSHRSDNKMSNNASPYEDSRNLGKDYRLKIYDII